MRIVKKQDKRWLAGWDEVHVNPVLHTLEFVGSKLFFHHWHMLVDVVVEVKPRVAGVQDSDSGWHLDDFPLGRG